MNNIFAIHFLRSEPPLYGKSCIWCGIFWYPGMVYLDVVGPSMVHIGPHQRLKKALKFLAR